MRELIDALGPGQMIVHGQCPTVGAGGLFLHGGYHTTLTLNYGRGNDTVLSMEVVTADGTVLELDEHSPHADLWQAMRQAGSSFAIGECDAKSNLRPLRCKRLSARRRPKRQPAEWRALASLLVQRRASRPR